MAGLGALLTLALFTANPPQRVTLDTYYGAVALDHAAHLVRVKECRSCHGDRAATPGRFRFATARDAHASCQGCHEQRKRGPTECRDCHARPDHEPPGLAAMESAMRGTPPAADEEGASAAYNQPPDPLAPPTRIRRRGPPVPPPDLEPPPPPAAWLELGPTALAGGGPGGSGGLTARVGLRSGHFLTVQSVDWGGVGRTRITGLFGAGVSAAARPDRSNTYLLAVAGFDHGPDRSEPAAGARLGLEWLRAFPGVDIVQLSGTGLYAFGGPRSARYGVGVALTLAFGLSREVPAARP